MYPSSEAKPYVYKLTHKLTGQFYIGYREANDLPSDQDLPIYQTSSKHIAKLGFENFDLLIIAEFTHGIHAYDYEQELIREHRSDPLILNKHFLEPDSLRLRYIRPRGTYKASAETRLKLSLAHKGRIMSVETRNRLSKALTGRSFSTEHRKNIGLSSKGRFFDDETRYKMGSGLRGKKRSFTAETKQRMSESAKARIRQPHSEETKQKMREKALIREAIKRASHLTSCFASPSADGCSSRTS